MRPKSKKSEYMSRRYKLNHERELNRVRTWRAEHPEENRAIVRKASKKWRKENPEYVKATYKWARENKEKRNAHCKVWRAVRSGKLVRPLACSLCGAIKKLDAHHHNGYAYPLDVQWVCRVCHSKQHRKKEK